MTLFHLAGPSLLVVVLFLLSTPITWAMAIGAFAFFLINMDMIPLANFAQEMAEGSQSVSLLALPLFVLAGCIMNASGITRRLLALADVLVGHMTGALAQMCTVLGTLLGGLTASANADAAMLAKTLGVESRNVATAGPSPRSSHRRRLSSRASFHRRSVLSSMVFGGDVHRPALRSGCDAWPRPGDRAHGHHLFHRPQAWLQAVAQGACHPRGGRPGADRRALGAVDPGSDLRRYAIRSFHHHGSRCGGGRLRALRRRVRLPQFTFRQIPEVLAEAVRDSAVVMIMICAAAAFGFYLAWEQVPQAMSGWLGEATDNPLLMLLLINVLLIVIGTAIEGSAALIILTPMLIPIIDGVGIDRVHFGVVFITNLTIAGITPPVGGLMYISSMVLKVPMMAYAREVLPYLAMMMVILVMLSMFPQLSLWLPNLVYGTTAVQ